MFHTHATAASSSNFQLILNNALKVYQKRTKNDLVLHPLAGQLQTCNSPSDILAVLQQQVQGLDQSRSGENRWTKWLDPTINVLLTFSRTVGTVGLAFSPVTVIFAGIGVLLSTAKDVRASQDTLMDIFERIEMFFRRLEMYTEVPLTMEIMVIIIQIMAEVISILGIATKDIKQGRTKKYMKRLVGRTDMEDALKRLDKLTQEEARMVVAENLKATHAVDERVKGIANTMTTMDNRVAGMDGRVASVDARVASVSDRVKVVDKKVGEVIHAGKEASLAIHQAAIAAKRLYQIKRKELREEIPKWLAPPDPSTNFNIACGTHHKKTATWFFQDRIYKEWKSKGSLLWIHGKPGSGKSVLCSTVIQDIETRCKAGNALMAYFYFDFRDAGKQGLQDLVRSLLTQLSVHLAPHCDILPNLYSAHDDGKKQPSDNYLAESLKEVLTFPDRRPTYLIIDALDESPNTPGMPSPRQKVLQLVKELVELRLPDLHICVTSRPEFDIRNVLEPLTSHRVSLHNQGGQKDSIADYVRSVVYSDSEQIMKRWRTEDKEFVIKTLSERADGMFRWVFCQLEILRDCFPSSVRRTLDELPESLDETYERVLREIKRPNRDHARRLLCCLVAAVRPLRVEELAEVIAVDFDNAEGIPRLNPNWRWEDEEQALLTSCSSLIVIVKSGASRVVQFSHFSVKEFLTSNRLATSSEDVLRYYIALESAHTTLAQTCMSALLRSDNRIKQNGVKNSSPLAGYAVRHWIPHAKYGNVSSCLRKAMDYLFDPDKPYFTAWLQLHDVDTRPSSGSTFFLFSPTAKLYGGPLYYASLCGLQDLVELLILKYPQQVNASGGYYVTPMVAALAGEHFQTAKILWDNGAHHNVRGRSKTTPLHSAAHHGHLRIIQVLLEFEADVNARNEYGETPLHYVMERVCLNPNLSQMDSIARFFLEHGAEVDAFSNDHTTPLHIATRGGRVEVVRVLLEHGADINTRSNDNSTSLHIAVRWGSIEVVPVLLEHGADVNARSDDHSTSLHIAAQKGRVEVVRVLLEHNADVNARSDDHSTPLHVAARWGRVGVVSVLLEHGVDVGAEDVRGRTPFQLASLKGHTDITKLLSEHGAK